MDKNKLSAYTIAEVMIVLIVIGILSAIIFPIANNSRPNEAILKFQKANSTLMSVISRMANNYEYFYNGDFGIDKNKKLITDPKYFCNALSDILNTKISNCSSDNLGYNTSAVAKLDNYSDDTISGNSTIYDYADCMCKNHTTSGEEIVLNDGVVIYTVNPYYHFGMKDPTENTRIFTTDSIEKQYKYICLDIDGINKGEDPFGYALRADGKILQGSRAKVWSERKIQDKTNEITGISSVASCPLNEYKPSPCGKAAFKITLNEKNYCITKYNIGDYSDLTIPTGISVANVDNNEVCSSSQSTPCCWQGKTANTCDSNNGDYSGCNRTLCDWWASMEACSKLTYLGKSWKLLPAEIIPYLRAESGCAITHDSGNEGLMLCTKSRGHCKDSICENSDNKCLGANYDKCYPYGLWTSSKANDIKAHYTGVSGGMQTTLTEGSFHYAFSARCVAEL